MSRRAARRNVAGSLDQHKLLCCVRGVDSVDPPARNLRWRDDGGRGSGGL